MKKAAFLDIDGTLHEGFVTPNFIFHLHEHNFINKKAIDSFDNLLNKDPRRYTNYSKWGPEITLMINSIFNGKSRNTITKYMKTYEKVVCKNFYTFTIPLIQLLKKQGFELFLITGTHDFLAEIVAVLLEISPAHIFAAKLIEKDGKFTEEMLLGSRVAAEKEEAIIKLEASFDLSKSIVLGDAGSDIKLFSFVGKGFLFTDSNSPDILLEEARKLHGTIINKTDETKQILTLIEKNLP
jgi:phosphoserine phosphatase